jgi:DNA-binding LacI/PurR family transcriptional regulator
VTECSSANLELEVRSAVPVHEQIGRQIRRMIERGELQEGDRLPPHPELARRIGATAGSVHKALFRLSSEGLLERRPGRGTFVRARSDRAVIGLLFGPKLSEEYAHFYRGLLRALEERLEGHHWTHRVYDGFRDPRRTPDSEARSYALLAKDCLNYHFSGLIAVNVKPKDLDASPDLRDIPRAVCHPVWDGGDVHSPWAEFVDRGVEWFVQHGRRRIQLLGVGTPIPGARIEDQLDEAFRAALAHAGLPALPDCCPPPIPSATQEREVCERCQEWFAGWRKLSASQRPDALLVSDDIAMRGVALALTREGIAVPNDLMVLCEGNDQAPFHYGVPVARYELKVRDMAGALVDLLWRRMTNGALPRLPIELVGTIREDEAKT